MIYHSRILLAFAVLLGLTPPIADAAPKRVALLVGVNEYQGRGFANLKCAENDMNTLAAELKRLDFNTVVLTGSGRRNSRATRVNILEQLESLLADVAKDDIVVVGLAGHGMQMQVPRSDGEPGEEAFYCPVDAVAGESESMLSLSYLLDDVLKKRGGRNIVFVDACPDAAAESGRNSASGIEGRLLTIPEDTAVFFSCRTGQKSFEDPDELNHGIFAYAIVKALRQAGAEGGTMHWFDVASRITRNFKLPEIVRAIPRQRIQEPILVGSMSDFVFASNTQEVRSIAAARPSAIRDVVGCWTGRYEYPAAAARDPVPFHVVFIQEGETLTGFLREPNTFGDFGFPYLYATIDGRVTADGSLRFKKTYDGTASVYHAVNYEGKLAGNATKLTNGTWDIPSQWGGKFTLEKLSPEKAKEQTSAWNGTYYYQNGAALQPVDFQMFLFYSGNQFEGFLKEPNTFARVNTPWLYATIKGRIDPTAQSLTFTKTYDGTGGENHDVRYGGQLSNDGTQIRSGRWEIRPDWGGKFTLRRFFP